jgi:hypothetical protein
VTCAPLLVKKGRTGALPVKTEEDKTWDMTNWKVEDGSGKEILSYTCTGECKEEAFKLKLDVAGVHRYSVEMKTEGESYQCGNVVLNYGELNQEISIFLKH